MNEPAVRVGCEVVKIPIPASRFASMREPLHASRRNVSRHLTSGRTSYGRTRCLHIADQSQVGFSAATWDAAAVVVPAVYQEWGRATPLVPPPWLVAQYSVYLYQRLNESASCFCPNRGYESGVYLRFLSDFHDRLPAIVAFVQADWLSPVRFRAPVAFDFWQLRCAFRNTSQPFSRWMPLGKRHTCWPPGQMTRTAAYWPNRRSRAPAQLIEACWHDLLGIFGKRPAPGTRLNLRFYPFQNFIASRAQLREHPHSSYAQAYARLVLQGTCLDPPLPLTGPWVSLSNSSHGGGAGRGGGGVAIQDSVAFNKETAGKGMEHLMHAIFGSQAAEGAPPAPIPAAARCDRLAEPGGAPCQAHGL